MGTNIRTALSTATRTTLNKRDLFKAAVAAGAVTIVAKSPVHAAFEQGDIIQLDTTPHIWVSDWQGVLHWAGDTRALQGRYINWSRHFHVWMSYLTRIRTIGDPWLSAGLLKDGDPIYLVKWETDWETPKLFHITDIRDVEIFGINETNYGKFVLEKAEWERRYRIDADTLERDVLSSTVPRVFDSCYQAFVLGAKDFHDSEENVGYYDWMVPSATDHDGDRIVCENARGQSRLEADQRGT